jgi:hypothetical protein
MYYVAEDRDRIYFIEVGLKISSGNYQTNYPVKRLWYYSRPDLIFIDCSYTDMWLNSRIKLCSTWKEAEAKFKKIMGNSYRQAVMKAVLGNIPVRLMMG